ncbi:MAG: (2Fe-2S) ferredoxin domain-containing protein [Elusimicrobia bacterium]|nr:(2Fe-2S) ferredoxin domain-containing protein [Elusimicrobiota bacterium]
MLARPAPYRKFVCVCTNARTDGRQACANPGRGGDEVWTKLKEGVALAGLKGNVRVTRSGCLGLCAHGPNVLIYPEGEWRSGVGAADVPEILKGLGA